MNKNPLNKLSHLIRFLLRIILSVLVLLSGCRQNPYEINIPDAGLDLKIKRLEVDLFSLDFDHMEDGIRSLQTNYGDFIDLFGYQIISIGGPDQITFQEYLRSFLTDYLNNQVYNRTMKYYPDLDQLEEELEIAFKHYKYYFPEREVPEIISYISGFNQSIVTTGNMLGVGLDKYLGRDCEYYKRLGLHKYLINNMTREKIPTDCMTGWGMTEFEFNDSVDNLLANMIYHGKIAYFTKSMLPRQPDSLVIGFTAKEMLFCEQNEARMWEYLVEHRELFESDRMTIMRYTGVGPFTKAFTTESPARAAVWLGWKIVESYARRIPDLKLSDIMMENDYQKILTLSKYNP